MEKLEGITREFATDHIWTMEDKPGFIGLRVDCGDSGVIYFTPDQAKQVVDAFQLHLAPDTQPGRGQEQRPVRYLCGDSHPIDEGCAEPDAPSAQPGLEPGDGVCCQNGRFGEQHGCAKHASSEPERVSDEAKVTILADRLDFLCRSAEKASCASVGEVHALACELRTLRADLAENDRQIKRCISYGGPSYEALLDYWQNQCLLKGQRITQLETQLAEKEQYAVNTKAALKAEFANHIKTRMQLAEKDAAIEKARREALEEAANAIKDMQPCPFDGPYNLEPTDPCPVCGDRGDDINAPSHCRSPLTVIRALAAQKKEG